MNAIELANIEEEIANLRIALGIEQRVFELPKGTTGRCELGTKGRCIVCDQEYEAYDTIRRCCRTNLIKTKGELREVTIGYRVCFRCCVYTYDWMLERYNQSIGEWPEAWKNGTDSGVFGKKSVTHHSVFELDLRDKTPEEEYLEDKIAKLEAQVKRNAL